MITTSAIRRMYRGRLQEARADQGLPQYRAGARAFLEEWYQTLGLVADERGRPTYLTEGLGHYHFGEGRAAPAEVSLRGLAEAIHGHEFVEEYYHPHGGNGFDFSDRHLLEAAIDPTAFINISTFNLAVSGLVFAQILEKFNQPEFIGRNLVRIVPTKLNGQKLIGVARQSAQSKAAKGRLPGEAHAEMQFGDAYQTTPETVEQALKCKVTKEAVFFDITGQVLDEASGVGDELGYGQEKDIADGVMGVTNSYNRNGTSYNTYQTTSPWINDQSNPFTDELNVDTARQLFVGMTDPESGKEIRVSGRDILCMPARELKFRQGLFGSNVQIGTQLNSNFPSRWTQAGLAIGQVSQGAYNLIPLSSIWYNRATASDGLNLSASNAKEYWWVGDFAKAFEWYENWPLTPWSASADESVMKDKGIVAVYGANYRGIFYVREPRYAVRNKN